MHYSKPKQKFAHLLNPIFISGFMHQCSMLMMRKFNQHMHGILCQSIQDVVSRTDKTEIHTSLKSVTYFQFHHARPDSQTVIGQFCDSSQDKILSYS